MKPKRTSDRAYTVTVFDKKDGYIHHTQAYKHEATALKRIDEWAVGSDMIERKGGSGWIVVLTTTEAPFVP